MGETLLHKGTMPRAIPRALRRKTTRGSVEHLRAKGFAATPRSVQPHWVKRAGRLFPPVCDDRGRSHAWQWSEQVQALDVPAMEPQTVLTFWMTRKHLRRIDSAKFTDTPAHASPGFNLDEYRRDSYLDFRLGDPLRPQIRIGNEIAQHLEETPVAEDQAMGSVENRWRELTATVLDTTQWKLLSVSASRRRGHGKVTTHRGQPLQSPRPRRDGVPKADVSRKRASWIVDARAGIGRHRYLSAFPKPDAGRNQQDGEA